MGKYLFIYYSDDDMSAAPTEDGTKAWMDWFGGLGDKIIDAGNPLMGGKAVMQSGVSELRDKPATGYSLVKADSLEEATKLTEGCPLLKSETGAICVYETIPM